MLRAVLLLIGGVVVTIAVALGLPADLADALRLESPHDRRPDESVVARDVDLRVAPHDLLLHGQQLWHSRHSEHPPSTFDG